MEMDGIKKSEFKIVIMSIDELKPHEKGSPLYTEILKNELLRDGIIRYPIIADEKTKVILDGMHRWLAMKSIGYRQIPVLLIDINENSEIRIGFKRVHRYIYNSDRKITAKEVISAGLRGELMRPRTTRHFFPFIKPPRIDHPLNLLKRDSPQDISKYLEKTTLDECKIMLKDWLDEIYEELEFLRKRINEVEKEKEEFINRIKNFEVTNPDLDRKA
jgi:hypothetical protein